MGKNENKDTIVIVLEHPVYPRTGVCLLVKNFCEAKPDLERRYHSESRTSPRRSRI